ncbi:Type 1 glutamine amidotransferase-like domain-containing protein [Microbacterium sp. CFBP 8794]|uniref:Type 1 glutamine amidotransferase-like domain-containing protein n=1 Tax=Microbacterium sp. CFBP 8794 TaxID=2775269 RepID=UPI00178633C3|nr:Type 1 glutamine amidotransferase-like domain-containing protein [Microbacterium sp. CFBP 8794]MBD8476765.1 Type 1 glutamine amidotransferase-like domain-containing protein [Microbacterium sp. CFBP 8794]
MSVHLLGGGRDVARCGALLRPFVVEARARADDRPPVIAVLLVLEADDDSSVARFAAVLEAAGAAAAELRVAAIVEGGTFDAEVSRADAVFVGGGLTPAYLDALAPILVAVAGSVRDGMPYAGFSAGAAIAAGQALAGGYRLGGIEVASEDAGEELDELEIRDGLGLVSFAVDVHAAQWGTLSRLVAAVDAELVTEGVAIDEHTALIVDAEGASTVSGSGHVWHVTAASPGVRVALRSA